MYLTKLEYDVLVGIKYGLSRKKMEEQLSIRLVTNDPRIESLCRKYGVEDSMNYQIELREKADLAKVEIVDIDKMPYYDYLNKWVLAKKNPISNSVVKMINKFFKEYPVKDEEYCNLIYTAGGLGFCHYIEVPKDNKKYLIRVWADGYIEEVIEETNY